MKRLLTVITLKLLLLTFCNSCYAQHTIASVYFKLGATALSLKSKKHLDSLAYHNILISSKHYNILGYADNIGTEEQNSDLSETRARNIAEYLHTLGINNIQTIIGEGEIDRPENAEGYPEDRRVDIIEVKQSAEKPKSTFNIDVTKLKKGDAIQLKNIFFIPGKHNIRLESKGALLSLLSTMNDNPTLRISIEGHICCMNPKFGNDGYDSDTKEWALSTNRAKFVYLYLVAKGVNRDRMEYKGFGISKPLVWPEKNEEDQSRNRRVEIRILDK